MRESTALGRNNYWHQEWNLAQTGNDPRFTNIFIPWYAEKSKYWLPFPADWIPSTVTLQFARRAQQEGPKYMHRPVVLSKEQLYWYERHYKAAQAREELWRFLSEYPSEPEEAFQNSGRSIFSIVTLTRVAGQARPLADLLVVKPRAELLADKEESLREFQESQRQLQAGRQDRKTREAARVLTVNEPAVVRVEEDQPV